MTRSQRNSHTQPGYLTTLIIVFLATQVSRSALGAIQFSIMADYPPGKLLSTVYLSLYFITFLTCVPTALFSVLLTWAIFWLQNRSASLISLCLISLGSTAAVILLFHWIPAIALSEIVDRYSFTGIFAISGILGSLIGAGFAWERLRPRDDKKAAGR